MPHQASYSGEIALCLDDFRARGHREASQHRPPTDAARLDEHEETLLSKANGWLNTEQRLFSSAVTEASRAANDMRQKVIQLQTEIDQLANDSSLMSSIAAELSSERGALCAASEHRLRAEVEWRSFRVQNGVNEQAVYPESKVWHFAIVAVFALIETGTNAFFYENSQGLVGGFTVALGVSILNMGTALALGYFYRHKNLAAFANKILGWASFFVFCVVAIYLNVLFAAFRSEYQVLADPSDVNQLRFAFAAASKEAGRIFVLNAHFVDLWSFILFGLGVLLSALAFWKGYTIDDKHPDYGRKDRALRAARAAEAALQDALRQRVTNSLQGFSRAVQAALRQPSTLMGALAAQVSQLKHAQTTLRAQVDSIERDFRLVLKSYRSANVAIRATPPPPYFQSTPALSGKVDPSLADAVIEELSGLQVELSKLRETAEARLNSRLQVIRDESATVLNTTLPQFINEVVEVAQDNINRQVPTIERTAGGLRAE